MADSKKLIVVFGATGAQGGSVVRSLLKDPKYRVRAVTRKADSPAAQELKKLGAEVVEANQDDVKSLEKAFEGAYGAFGVTNFWEAFYEGEIRQGKNVADAAKAAGIKHYVWSTLDNCNVPHFVTKYIIGEYCKQIGLPTTHLYTGFYYENMFSKFLPAQKDPATGKVTWNIALPADKQMPVYAVEDTGAFVLAALNNPAKWLNKEMRISSEFITPNQLNEVVKRVCGPQFSFNSVDLEWFRHSKLPEEIYLNMVFFINNQESSGLRDTKLTREIYPAVQTWETFLRNHEAEWKKLLQRDGGAILS